MSSSLLGPHSPLEAMSKLCDWERPWDFALHDLWAGDVLGTSTWLGQVCQCPSRHVQEDPRPLLPRLPLALLISSPYSFPFLPSPQPFLARLSPSRWGCPSFCTLASFFLDISLFSLSPAAPLCSSSLSLHLPSGTLALSPTAAPGLFLSFHDLCMACLLQASPPGFRAFSILFHIS